MLRRELFGGALLLVPLLRARGESCGAADPNELGPFYRASAPERATLCDAAEPGKRFTAKGRILGEGCAPIAGALVEVWHASDKGEYDMLAPGKPRDPGVYHLRGVLKSGSDGAFEVHTIVPGHYATRARHIHYLVHSDGYEPFVTQSYFPGDARLKTDPIVRTRNVVSNGRFRMLLRRQRPNPPEAVARFDGYEGEYLTPDKTRVTVTRAGDSIFAEVDGFPKVELRFEAPDRYRIVEFDGQGHADRGQDGKVVALTLRSFGDTADMRIVR
jgi:protocatechuate 3,4-dioxygenase beta subunit